MKCIRCEKEMAFLGKETIQLGKTGWVLGDLPNLISGAMTVSIFRCPECGKLEFFQNEEDFEKRYGGAEELPQKTCPKCGTVHDFDYPKCPHCSYKY
ncbi:MAG: hypothetical protein E7623_02580 [Ruminococcaceae bacterium]|nr:hypothetical protein [Oscillospiraceae bacterium]